MAPNSSPHVLSVAFSPDGKSILTGSADNTTRLWSVTTCQILYSVSSQYGDVSRVAFSNAGKSIVVAEGSVVRVLDAANGQSLHIITARES